MTEVLLKQVSDYVINCFLVDLPKYLRYHNLIHTETVVTRVNEISDFYRLEESKKFILLASAWFHDIGYLYATSGNHEEKSVEIMETFLHSACSQEIINEIKRTILATRYPTSPEVFIEEIICDADTYHFGTPEFLITDKLVKSEIELITGMHPLTFGILIS